MSRIYLVDDHEILRSAIKRSLLQQGHTIVGESDGSDTLVSAISESEAEILLLDLRLRITSGLSILQSLSSKKMLNELKIIILSMSTHAWQVKQAMELGAHAFVWKGAAFEELTDAINSVAKGRRFIDSKTEQNVSSHRSDLMENLSVREIQILEGIVHGRSSREIGDTLFISPKTVDTYRSRLMHKLNLSSHRDILLFAQSQGLLDSA